MASLPSAGSIFADKLRIDAVIGRGSMGIVYGATDLILGRRVALKVIAPEMLDGDQRVRFEREARAAAALRSEHAVRIYEAGSTPMPYLVMEYLQGQNLEQLVTERGPLSITQAVAYLLEALDAIAEAHRAGFVHRDLKPANLFLDGTRALPMVKVLDFGLVRTNEPSGSTPLTATGVMMGTPLYMAPEQVDAKPVGPPADVWSLGVTLYELLTGRTPFEASTTMETFTRILREPPVPMGAWRADVPGELLAIVERCLAKAPEQRFASGSELASVLAAFAGRSTARGAPSQVIIVPAPVPEAAPPRTRSLAVPVVCLLGIFAAGGAAYAWHEHEGAHEMSPPPIVASASASAAAAPSAPSAPSASTPPAPSATAPAWATRARSSHHVLAKAEYGFDNRKRFAEWIRTTQPLLDRCVGARVPCYGMSVGLRSDGSRRGVVDVGYPEASPPRTCSPKSDALLGKCLTDALLTAPPPFTCQGTACQADVLLYVAD